MTEKDAVNAAEKDERSGSSPYPELPPEIEDSVKWAGESLQIHQESTGSDEDEALSDLLSDLMHWCEHNDVDFEDELRRATDNYEYERDSG